jgi:hypothetical protein
MNKTTCDVCKQEIPYNNIRIEVLDGEHPHNGSTMHKDIDICVACISKLSYSRHVKCDVEFSHLRSIVTNN